MAPSDFSVLEMYRVCVAEAPMRAPSLAWVAEGYAVHAFELRGHARSEGERVWVERFDEYVEDMKLFVQRVKAKEPGKPVFLFGYSMGGAISTLYALAHPAQVNGLILSAAALKPGKDINGFLIAMSGVVSTLSPRSKLLESEDTLFSRDPQVVAQMKSDPLILQGNGPARTGAELLKAMETIGKRRAELKVPLLAMHGTADALTNPEGSAELVANAATTDKTLNRYEGLYHDLVHEPERAKVIADMVAWLNAR
ncbi:alpha/beta hydrolase, partial [Pyxidicoccus trucidator]|uniref:alpha/beta hydrolase n=1 Tax=Pyxidicoccus trucidator TaxID=2709662 RepID=UPI0013DB7090